MSKTILIHENGETREATEQEAKELLETQAQAQKEQSLIEAKQLEKDSSRASALAKLAALGLTEEEIAAL
jgi:DNA-binding NarL/FixJ family response regulator